MFTSLTEKFKKLAITLQCLVSLAQYKVTKLATLTTDGVSE